MRYKARVRFEVHITATGSHARAGTVHTSHGAIPTPAFMPVGTRGTVRTQTLAQLLELDPPIVLANTYHLLVRPGPELFARAGGLHRWMAWPRAILTDSGGFQIFSLRSKIAEEGAMLPTQQGPLLLTPERSIAMQRAIGSDVMMALDVCIPSTASHAEAAEAMERTHRWAARSRAAAEGAPGALFAIVQGACHLDLRRRSVDALAAMDFPGYAIGGLAVGETRAEREDTTELVAQLLPAERPRYLMGVGTPLDILEGVHRGIDMFDCVLPTAWAQQGIAFTSRGRVDLRRGAYFASERPLDPACPCAACTTYTRSYLHHLVRCKEPLGWQLLAFHNLRHYLELARAMQRAIAADAFAAFYREQREVLGIPDADHAPGPAPVKKPRRPTERGAFALHVSTHGHTSIRHVPSGEIMHSVNAPDAEAARIYVAQSRLLARAVEDPAGAPLVVWDVGLGAGHNAMALVRRLEGLAHAPVELVSFERDLDAFLLALDHGKPFAHLRHEAPHRLAAAGAYRRDGLAWTLQRGNFLDGFAHLAPPDVVFWDPFSQKVDGPMWSLATFRRLRAHADRGRPVELFTYSCSTAVRSAMLAAGFSVARGAPSGPKQETTIALLHSFSGHELLDRAWLARRARSTAPFPPDVSADERAALEQLVAAHPQFSATS
ncbi:MAG: tRNA guanosine(34) transglycosylase Tgt [Deltaproteobacteria bacterium]|nr:tRNA guanosine(34) transglycosylase Tgt [Deltaproteobacteria bacterium]